MDDAQKEYAACRLVKYLDDINYDKALIIVNNVLEGMEIYQRYKHTDEYCTIDAVNKFTESLGKPTQNPLLESRKLFCKHNICPGSACQKCYEEEQRAKTSEGK